MSSSSSFFSSSSSSSSSSSASSSVSSGSSSSSSGAVMAPVVNKDWKTGLIPDILDYVLFDYLDLETQANLILASNELSKLPLYEAALIKVNYYLFFFTKDLHKVNNLFLFKDNPSLALIKIDIIDTAHREFKNISH